MSHYSTPNGIRIGHRKTGLKFDSLSYRDNIVIFAEYLEIAIEQIEILK